MAEQDIAPRSARRSRRAEPLCPASDSFVISFSCGQHQLSGASVIPEQVGEYTIERKIGSGGMGTVYLGRHRSTGTVAAVKVLPASLAREDGFVLRFTREIQAMQTLSNPHVVEVYESGVDDETYFYAMEYVDGETLSQRLRERGKIPWRDVIEYSIQICSALKAAHDAGIVHRDLKPSNLIITTDNQIKLLDFGVAQVFASSKLTKTGGIIGTAEYMSPEQAKGQRASNKSDIYSLGGVMYAMLTARPPFTGKTSMEIIQKHQFGIFDRPRTWVPEIPYWLDDLVCQCLNKDPDKRFPDAYVLSLRLKEIVKKVDLSEKDATSVTGSLDGTAETMVAEPDPNAFGGTLMRDLMQAEIQRAEHASPLQRAFDNTWILLGLLILLIGGLWYAFQSRERTPEQQFAAGKALFEQGTLYWSQARTDYFQPLLDSDPETWTEPIEPMLRKIEVQELKQDFGLTRLSARKVTSLSDDRRFLHMAREYYKLGDTVRAQQILQQLVDLLRGQPDQAAIRLAVQEILVELRERDQANEARGAAEPRLSRQALERARTYLAAGETESALSILLSLITLYDGDPQAEDDVAQARQLVDSLRKSRS